MTQPDPHPEVTAETTMADPPTRHRWTRVFGLGLASFLLWLLLFAPTLQHNAQVSPVGTRRTVSLDLLGPIADISRVLQLSRIVQVTDDLTGRTGNRPGNGSITRVEGVQANPPENEHRPSPVTTTTLPPITHPTAADPLRVLIVGDSLGIDMGGPLQNDLATTGVVTAALDGRESTGLTRPDYFNWPAELQTDLTSDRPQVIVILMGANDAQDFPGPPDVPYTSSQWNVLYATRVSDFMHLAQSQGAQVIWVGLPPMQNPALSAQMADINYIDQTQASLQAPRVHFISTWKLIGTAQGTYTPFITSAGQVVNVRTPDGIHLTPAGGEVISQRVIKFMQSDLHIELP